MSTVINTAPLVRRINALVREHGSLRNAANAVDVDPGMLSRIRAGKVSPVTGDTLDKLGMCARVTYRSTQDAK